MPVFVSGDFNTTPGSIYPLLLAATGILKLLLIVLCLTFSSGFGWVIFFYKAGIPMVILLLMDSAILLLTSYENEEFRGCGSVEGAFLGSSLGSVEGALLGS
jgi:hypothetical protein